MFIEDITGGEKFDLVEKSKTEFKSQYEAYEKSIKAVREDKSLTYEQQEEKIDQLRDEYILSVYGEKVEGTEEKQIKVTREVTNDITTNTIKKMLNNGLEPDNISMYFDNITVEDIESIRASL